ncbi:hypothetical protein LCGC14_1723530, partial [marine sediment metagenome]
ISMKDMSSTEKELFVSTVEERAEAVGIDYELPLIDRIVDKLQKISKKDKDLTPTQELHRDKISKMTEGVKAWGSTAYHEVQRMERFMEDLDGEENGVLWENIWLPVKKADETRVNTVSARTDELIRWLEESDIDVSLFLGKAEEVTPGVKLSGSERVGVYMLAQNEDGQRYLNEGMGVSDEDITKIAQSLSDAEKVLGDKLMEEYQSQWPVIHALAVELDIDPDTLQEELQYSPLIRSDVDPSEQVDFLDQLTEHVTRGLAKPEHGFMEKRKKRAVGKIELDAIVIYLNNVRRVESYKAMAPVAKKVGAMLRNKSFQKSLKEATYGQGARLFNKWFSDTIKGYSAVENGWAGKNLQILRRNAVVYAIGYNIPSAMRQTLSLSNAIAVNKLMLKYVPINMTKAAKDFDKLRKEVYNKSTLVEARDYERDLRQRWDREAIKKRVKGKNPFSQRATAWIKWMDQHTVVVAWKSLYDVAVQQGKDEKSAVEYADKWVGRTQPMANSKDLPQFFRDGELAKILSTFQNQVNNNFNFYSHDIIGARAKGEINNSEVAHRLMFSWVLPAVAFGMIGRGGLPRSWEQIAVDLVTYPIASLMLIGRLINRAILGWGNSSTIVSTGFEAAVRTGIATTGVVKKTIKGKAVGGDVKKAIKGAAKTIGAIGGLGPTAQMIRTATGAADLAAGDTQDPRRLIWSKWALEQGKKEESSGGRGRSGRGTSGRGRSGR